MARRDYGDSSVRWRGKGAARSLGSTKKSRVSSQNDGVMSSAAPTRRPKSAVNMLSTVPRQELTGVGIAVSLLLHLVAATEFGESTYTFRAQSRPGIAQSPDYGVGFAVRVPAHRRGDVRHPAWAGAVRPRPGTSVRLITGPSQEGFCWPA